MSAVKKFAKCQNTLTNFSFKLDRELTKLQM